MYFSRAGCAGKGCDEHRLRDMTAALVLMQRELPEEHGFPYHSSWDGKDGKGRMLSWRMHGSKNKDFMS